jgi:hypothetical protein
MHALFVMMGRFHGQYSDARAYLIESRLIRQRPQRHRQMHTNTADTGFFAGTLTIDHLLDARRSKQIQLSLAPHRQHPVGQSTCLRPPETISKPLHPGQMPP